MKDYVYIINMYGPKIDYKDMKKICVDLYELPEYLLELESGFDSVNIERVERF